MDNESEIVKNKGNVGIGTTSPGAPLDVYYAGGASEIFVTRGNNVKPAGAIKFQGNDGTDYWKVGVNRLVGNMYELNYKTTTHMVVLENGNVGIGTTSPLGKLTVVLTEASPQGTLNTVATPNLLVLNGATSGRNLAGLHVETSASGSPYNGDLAIFNAYYDGGADYEWKERMRVTAAGNVGIGTTAPAVKLDVAGTINSTSLTDNYIPKHVSDTSGLADSRIVNTSAK